MCIWNMYVFEIFMYLKYVCILNMCVFEICMYLKYVCIWNMYVFKICVFKICVYLEYVFIHVFNCVNVFIYLWNTLLTVHQHDTCCSHSYCTVLLQWNPRRWVCHILQFSQNMLLFINTWNVSVTSCNPAF